MPTEGKKKEVTTKDLTEDVALISEDSINKVESDLETDSKSSKTKKKKSEKEVDKNTEKIKATRETTKKKESLETEIQEVVKPKKTRAKKNSKENESSLEENDIKEIDKETLIKKVTRKRKLISEGLPEEKESVKDELPKGKKKDKDSKVDKDSKEVLSLTDEILTKVKSGRKKSSDIKENTDGNEIDEGVKSKRKVSKKNTQKDETNESVEEQTELKASKGKKSTLKDKVGEKLEIKSTVAKKTRATGTKKKIVSDEEVIEEKSGKNDITLGELLEQAQVQEEVRDGKENIKKLKNISETIRADGSKRKKRKNDAALVMATITGNQEVESQIEEEQMPVMVGFPIDVTGIDFERERFEAEQECIEDFARIVHTLSKEYDEINAVFNEEKDRMIERLVELEQESQFRMKELRMKQNDLVNRIAEIQEVILIKKTELEKLGFTAFHKKNKIKQLVLESENEISQLEMEALEYNSKSISIIEGAAKERSGLFEAWEIKKEKKNEVGKKLFDAETILKNMESREEIDEYAVQKKLILKALKLYPKPMTIGQLLYYPGLSGYSVQRMSAAINQLVLEKLVLKVALEDNVYYIIANNEN